MVRKTICLLLCLALSLPLFSCGGTGSRSVPSVTTRRDPDRSRTAETQTEAPSIPDKTKTVLNVPFQDQEEFPSGCESASAVMALQYAGVEITLAEFVEKYLACDRDFTETDGVLYGPDPEKVFAGHPTENGFGCFPDVIENAVAKSGAPVETFQPAGFSLDELCDWYVDQGTPVLVWASMEMRPFIYQKTWILKDSGKSFTWPGREHCLLLVGYDRDNFYFNDPLNGKNISYPRELSEQRYTELGRRALVIRPSGK